MPKLLSVKELTVRFAGKEGYTTIVDRVSFDVQNGEILCVVGESGCGKSTIAMSILQLLSINGEISGGHIIMDGQELTNLTEDEMCEIRGNNISMIFQDPMSSLNPTKTVASQLIEPYIIHKGMKRKAARAEALNILKDVGIPNPEKRLDEYPHQLSGGMRQRVMIAMALACQPKLLIADEPTTALDVTIQAQILDLMRTLRKERGTAIVFITHDLGVVAEMADKVLVLYAGHAVEYNTVEKVFNSPKHPYTMGLLKSVPPVDKHIDFLPSIEGIVPTPGNMPKGCRFYPRCKNRMDICKNSEPKEYNLEDGWVKCFLYSNLKEDKNEL
ncbi:ABC transporter ATP-binding protein [Treponema denticola]|jgi:oligopeptide/dipeptide ABC transporter, ATP-binding protein, C-terminal domain|uniref:Oligopeptide/dipeptide ABC transporter, ATP-binding protein n=2 Tax=Treponema denticola TaxID=158 RepID=Q73N83_TREDE|nr:MULTISPECIES: ABC transporter ATP-binding protein [Treponema]AAS11790.1 oligopeptide/dipeptide ABC transporter, ATP-binding protein [Treponema denticola ATCC 35405]EMB28565.1 oligopeptide/dipeptide ABC transporter, ATP-binding protein [Treponema denticola MYR-T]EMB29307.1 oligopeptide/dipeptide ABC transporter, ATP-binding protein [Treponema denticola H1-T]EMB37195.1 oligopeptide/dipeptide ABC transporter, ATP-binding protein [Treponema denticola ATCC 33521]EMB41332.1 oligopeptide/dipeptide